MAKTFEDVVALLNQDLDTKRVAYRQSPGTGQVPYLEGYDVIDSANEVFDFRWSFDLGEPKIERWQRPVTRWNNQTRTKEPIMDGSGNPVMEWVGLVYVTGKVSVTLGDEIHSHSDLGRSIIAGDSPESLDTAIAGAATDCLKRCFRQLGKQFGNSLYDKDYRQDVLGEGGQGNGGGGQRQGNSAPRAAQSNAPRPNGNGAASNNKPAGESKPEASKSTASAPTAVAEGFSEEQINGAKQVAIPTGVPMAGKTLGEAAGDMALGVHVVRWLSGEVENKGGKKFAPANKDDEAVQESAKILVWKLKQDGVKF